MEKNYEEKYKSALKWIKAIYTELSHSEQEEAELFFPELREPDDKKIKKCIIDTLKGYHHLISTGGITKEDMIAWIEKQGEKQDYNPYKATVESIASMCDRYSTSDDLKDFYNNIKVKCKDAVEYDNTWIKKQGEQRPEPEHKAKFVENDICRECDNGNWISNLCWKGHSRCDGQKCIDFEKDEEL